MPFDCMHACLIKPTAFVDKHFNRIDECIMYHATEKDSAKAITPTHRVLTSTLTSIALGSSWCCL